MLRTLCRTGGALLQVNNCLIVIHRLLARHNLLTVVPPAVGEVSVIQSASVC